MDTRMDDRFCIRALSVALVSLNNTKHRYLTFLLLNNNTIKIATRVFIVNNFAQEFLKSTLLVFCALTKVMNMF